MNLIQEDNFFPNLNLILPEIKKIKLYSQEEIRQIDKYNKNATWPGYRSLSLTETNPILHDYVCYLMNANNLLERGRWIIASFVHLRLHEDENKDWIHCDNNELAGLIYLSNTNLNSGNSPVSLSEGFTSLETETQGMPESVANAVTRDYSDLMKAIDNKKSK